MHSICIRMVNIYIYVYIYSMFFWVSLASRLKWIRGRTQFFLLISKNIANSRLKASKLRQRNDVATVHPDCPELLMLLFHAACLCLGEWITPFYGPSLRGSCPGCRRTFAADFLCLPSLTFLKITGPNFNTALKPKCASAEILHTSPFTAQRFCSPSEATLEQEHNVNPGLSRTPS